MDKKLQKQSLIDAVNAPMPTMQQMGQGMTDMATQAKKAVLQRLMGQKQPTAIPRTPEEDLALKMKGNQAVDASKAQEANNVINQLQQEIQDADDMKAFGQPVNDQDLASKKEMLRKYLMNNR